MMQEEGEVQKSHRKFRRRKEQGGRWKGNEVALPFDSGGSAEGKLIIGLFI
jgi:hypothetical protein